MHLFTLGLMPLSVQVLLMAGNKDSKSVTFPGLILCGVSDNRAMTLFFYIVHTDGDANQGPMGPAAFDISATDQRRNSPIRRFPKLIFS